MSAPSGRFTNRTIATEDDFYTLQESYYQFLHTIHNMMVDLHLDQKNIDKKHYLLEVIVF